MIRLDLAHAMQHPTNNTQLPYESINIKCLIIDFSALSYIDSSAVSSLKLLIKDFNRLSVDVYIAGASCKKHLFRSSFFSNAQILQK